MGKKVTIYLDDEVLDKLKAIERHAVKSGKAEYQWGRGANRSGILSILIERSYEGLPVHAKLEDSEGWLF